MGRNPYLFSSLLQGSESILGSDTVLHVMSLDLPLNLDCHNKFREWAATLTKATATDEPEETVDYFKHQGRVMDFPS